MEKFDDLLRPEQQNDPAESAKSRLSAAFGDELLAQLTPPLKQTGEGSGVLRPPEVKPPVPKDTAPPKDTVPPKDTIPAPKDTIPAPKDSLPAPKDTVPPKDGGPKVDAAEAARAAKVKDVVDLLADKSTTIDKAIKKIETAYRAEENKDTMEELTRRINEGLKGSGVTLDLHPFRNHRTNMAVKIDGIGLRPMDIFVGPGKNPKR